MATFLQVYIFICQLVGGLFIGLWLGDQLGSRLGGTIRGTKIYTRKHWYSFSKKIED